MEIGASEVSQISGVRVLKACFTLLAHQSRFTWVPSSFGTAGDLTSGQELARYRRLG